MLDPKQSRAGRTHDVTTVENTQTIVEFSGFGAVEGVIEDLVPTAILFEAEALDEGQIFVVKAQNGIPSSSSTSKS